MEENETVVQRGDWRGRGEQDRREAERHVKASRVGVDSHYRDNNRMFFDDAKKMLDEVLAALKA